MLLVAFLKIGYRDFLLFSDMLVVFNLLFKLKLLYVIRACDVSFDVCLQLIFEFDYVVLQPFSVELHGLSLN